METIATNNQLEIINKSIEIFKTGPAILKANQERSERAVIVGKTIVQQWDAAWAINDKAERLKALAAADERSNKYLSNCSSAKTQENAERAVITQLMTEYAKMFIAAENALDKSKPGTVPAQVQSNRDSYAQELAEQQKRIEREAAEDAEKQKAIIEHKAKISLAIAKCLNDFLSVKKQKIIDHFNQITLDNIEEKAVGLANLSTDFPLTKIHEIVSYTVAPSYPFSQEHLKQLDTEAFEEFDFTNLYDNYEKSIAELKRDLIDRLPSKKAELESIAKEKEADRLRQEEIARAEGEKKKQLEEEAKAAEAARLNREADIRNREEEEATKLRRQAEEREKSAQLSIDMNTQAAQTMVMFEREAAVSEVTPKPETRTGYNILIQHPSAYGKIFLFFMEKEGNKLGIEELGRKTLDQMKKFCESYALKTGEKIDSNLLSYQETYKSISRKIA